MVRAYYQNFANLNFKNFVTKCSGTTKDMYTKLHVLNMKSVILDDGEYFREYFNTSQWEEIKSSCISICKDLRKDAYALTQLVYSPNMTLGV